MLRMYGFDGGAPLRRAYGGITDTGPAVRGPGGPEVIPVRKRLEAVEPVTLDGVPVAHVTLMGGPEKTLWMLRQGQEIVVERDRATDIYARDAGGRTSVEAVRALRMPEMA
jgi:hypothetical protein